MGKTPLEQVCRSVRIRNSTGQIEAIGISGGLNYTGDISTQILLALDDMRWGLWEGEGREISAVERVGVRLANPDDLDLVKQLCAAFFGEPCPPIELIPAPTLLGEEISIDIVVRPAETLPGMTPDRDVGHVL